MTKTLPYLGDHDIDICMLQETRLAELTKEQTRLAELTKQLRTTGPAAEMKAGELMVASGQVGKCENAISLFKLSYRVEQAL